MRDIFEERKNFKPFEYPEVMKFREAIRMSRWDIEEFSFDEDVLDFKKVLNNMERNIIKNTMLAISQVEAANVKTFWANIGKVLKKPEIEMVGITFGENEITHSMAYSKLLEVLGFNDEFKTLLESDVISGRVNYLNKYLVKKQGMNEEQFFTISLTLFTLFVERVSLFSQFAIIKSFRKHKNLLKSIDNVVLSTQKDELCHAMFGAYLINTIKSERPEWFNNEFYETIYKACKKAYKAELEIINWIFKDGETDIIKRDEIIEFTKNNFNTSLEMIGGKPIFEIDIEKLRSLLWFEEEMLAYVRNDFFATKSSNYNKVKVKVSDIEKSIKRFLND